MSAESWRLPRRLGQFWHPAQWLARHTLLTRWDIFYIICDASYFKHYIIHYIKHYTFLTSCSVTQPVNNTEIHFACKAWNRFPKKKYCITVLYAAFSLKWMHCITVIMYIALYSTDGGVWFQIDCKAYEQILISICYSSFFTILPNANRNIKWSFTGNQTIAWPSDGHPASALLLAENSPTNDDDDDCDICDDFYGEESLLRMVPGNVDENVITAITILPKLWWASI